MTSPFRVRIIGPGRAGGSLRSALQVVGWPVDMLDRQANIANALADTDLLILAVPDGVIADVATAIRPGEGVVAHLSGSRTLDVLEPHAKRASIHPLMTLPDADRGGAHLLDDCAFAVSGDAIARQLVDALGGRAFTVDDEDRATYHAAASIAANHLVALCAQVERLAASIGAPPDAFWDLATASLDNVRGSGSIDALTGPASRGDWATIAAHLASLPASEHDLYRELSKAAADLAGQTWPPNLDQTSD